MVSAAAAAASAASSAAASASASAGKSGGGAAAAVPAAPPPSTAAAAFAGRAATATTTSTTKTMRAQTSLSSAPTAAAATTTTTSTQQQPQPQQQQQQSQQAARPGAYPLIKWHKPAAQSLTGAPPLSAAAAAANAANAAANAAAAAAAAAAADAAAADASKHMASAVPFRNAPYLTTGARARPRLQRGCTNRANEREQQERDEMLQYVHASSFSTSVCPRSACGSWYEQLVQSGTHAVHAPSQAERAYTRRTPSQLAPTLDSPASGAALAAAAAAAAATSTTGAPPHHHEHVRRGSTASSSALQSPVGASAHAHAHAHAHSSSSSSLTSPSAPSTLAAASSSSSSHLSSTWPSVRVEEAPLSAATLFEGKSPMQASAAGRRRGSLGAILDEPIDAHDAKRRGHHHASAEEDPSVPPYSTGTALMATLEQHRNAKETYTAWKRDFTTSTIRPSTSFPSAEVEHHAREREETDRETVDRVLVELCARARSCHMREWFAGIDNITGYDLFKEQFHQHVLPSVLAALPAVGAHSGAAQTSSHASSSSSSSVTLTPTQLALLDETLFSHHPRTTFFSLMSKLVPDQPLHVPERESLPEFFRHLSPRRTPSDVVVERRLVEYEQKRAEQAGKAPIESPAEAVWGDRLGHRADGAYAKLLERVSQEEASDGYVVPPVFKSLYRNQATMRDQILPSYPHAYARYLERKEKRVAAEKGKGKGKSVGVDDDEVATPVQAEEEKEEPEGRAGGDVVSGVDDAKTVTSPPPTAHLRRSQSIDGIALSSSSTTHRASAAGAVRASTAVASSSSSSSASSGSAETAAHASIRPQTVPTRYALTPYPMHTPVHVESGIGLPVVPHARDRLVRPSKLPLSPRSLSTSASVPALSRPNTSVASSDVYVPRDVALRQLQMEDKKRVTDRLVAKGAQIAAHEQRIMRAYASEEQERKAQDMRNVDSRRRQRIRYMETLAQLQAFSGGH